MWPIIKNWNAHRSGAYITIHGEVDGEHRRIPNVTSILVVADGVMAETAIGTRFRLAIAADRTAAQAA